MSYNFFEKKLQKALPIWKNVLIFMIVNKKYMKKDPVDVFTTVAAVFAISVIALWAVANVFKFVAWLFS